MITTLKISEARGRAVDGLVAEALFGWRWWACLHSGEWRCALFHPDFPPSIKPEDWRDVTDDDPRPERYRDWDRAADVPEGLTVPCGVPLFSRDNNATALVLAWANEHGYLDQVGIHGEVGTRAVARFKERGERFAPWIIAVEDTRPLAICRAALLVYNWPAAAKLEFGELPPSAWPIPPADGASPDAE